MDFVVLRVNRTWAVRKPINFGEGMDPTHGYQPEGRHAPTTQDA